MKWGAWLEEHGPTVVLVWASWAPRSQAALDESSNIAAEGAARDLGFVVLDVQEPYADARDALAGSGFEWFHDRHGALLKLYHVIRVPSLVVLSASGEVEARLDVSAEALRTWSTQ